MGDEAMSMTDSVGTISGLWIYPVQSLRGQAMAALDFRSGGLTGDRGYGIADLETGIMVGSSSAKRAWRPLVTWEAVYLRPLQDPVDLPPVEIRFPDGTQVTSDDAGIHRRLSDRLGRAVELQRNDGSRAQKRYALSHCHLLTSATLRRLAAAYPEGRFDPVRFRPNIVLDCGDRVGFIEKDWLGRTLAADAGVRLDVTAECVRCAMPTRAQGDLPDDPGILHTVTALNHSNAGIYASVAATGMAAMGDAMRFA